jgi:hypothetical protein
MYTLLELQAKTFAALKQIGDELNVLPEGDRRYRQSWSDAIAGVNPPLLQLLETSPTDVQAQESPITETVEASPAAENVQAQELPIESNFGRIVYPQPAQGQGAIAEKSAFTPLTRCFNCEEEDGFVFDRWGDLVECPLCDGSRWKEIPEGDRTGAENSPAVEVDQAREQIAQAAETFLGVEVDPLDDVSPPCCNCFGDGFIEDEFGLIKICQCETEPRLSHKKTQRAIAQAAKNSPGVSRKTSTAHQLLDLFKSSVHIIEDSPASETEGGMVESAIAPAAENLPRSESDPNPILTGIVLSDKFLARYSPPQPENIHYQADADGQLSLLNFGRCTLVVC